VAPRADAAGLFKLNLIRYVFREFAKATKSLPAGKDGFLVFVGKPINPICWSAPSLPMAPPCAPATNVQISRLEFRDHQIVVDLNGAAAARSAGAIAFTSKSADFHHDHDQHHSSNTDHRHAARNGQHCISRIHQDYPGPNSRRSEEAAGSFSRFTKQRSAPCSGLTRCRRTSRKPSPTARAMPGMDAKWWSPHRPPDHKVRERDSEGNDIEDWIYASLPQRPVFVRFTGERVTSIKQFPSNRASLSGWRVV